MTPEEKAEKYIEDTNSFDPAIRYHVKQAYLAGYAEASSQLIVNAEPGATYWVTIERGAKEDK